MSILRHVEVSFLQFFLLSEIKFYRAYKTSMHTGPQLRQFCFSCSHAQWASDGQKCLKVWSCFKIVILLVNISLKNRQSKKNLLSKLTMKYLRMIMYKYLFQNLIMTKNGPQCGGKIVFVCMVQGYCSTLQRKSM